MTSSTVIAPEFHWAPDKIKAGQFKYKGPLKVFINEPVTLTHDLENVEIDSPKSQDHIVFDDDLNEVHEIGSEVEVIMDSRTVGQNNP
ncbi:unnamed protein product [Thelazia callipaeda]|uniref:Reverse transcriptase domain-containing protein n=1 Tax=Thelazia callipaeda TaxID=103827 RepID=A0A0N5D1S9_THECL|nr:unnamed protein product [Thelazia callipaeda]